MHLIIIMVYVLNLCVVQCTQHIGHMDCLWLYTYTWLSPKELAVFAVLLAD